MGYCGELLHVTIRQRRYNCQRRPQNNGEHVVRACPGSPLCFPAMLHVKGVGGRKASSSLDGGLNQIMARKEVSISHSADSFVTTDDEGLEKETIAGGERITEPFDPTLIRVEPRPSTVDLLLSRIKLKEIDLSPAFQRHDGIWNDGAQSRLIESLLIRIPLPAFYMDATDEDQWVVVDGLQRLSTLRRFVIEQKLRLTELEFLSKLNGKTFDELPRSFQRRILETPLTLFLIERGTPAEVKFNIFKRINTGGLPLSPQEIRHALNQGSATSLLERLAASPEFLRATQRGISPKRMGDRECALRFLAFVITAPEDYKAQDFDGFLNETMEKMNGMPEDELQLLESKFKRAMQSARDCFGDYAFRKRYDLKNSYKFPINKALFEAWSVNLNNLAVPQLNQLATIEKQNPVADPEERPIAQEKVSTTDPDAAWAVKSGPATLGYYDNYLVDTTSRVILSVEPTPARFRQETLAARPMLERVSHFGVRPLNLAADKAYGSGEFLAWLLEHDIQPHIPVIDRRHQTQGHFTREQFRYEPQENAYYCPEGKPLRYRGLSRSSQGYIYRATEAQC